MDKCSKHWSMNIHEQTMHRHLNTKTWLTWSFQLSQSWLLNHGSRLTALQHLVFGIIREYRLVETSRKLVLFLKIHRRRWTIRKSAFTLGKTWLLLKVRYCVYTKSAGNCLNQNTLWYIFLHIQQNGVSSSTNIVYLLHYSDAAATTARWNSLVLIQPIYHLYSEGNTVYTGWIGGLIHSFLSWPSIYYAKIHVDKMFIQQKWLPHRQIECIVRKSHTCSFYTLW